MRRVVLSLVLIMLCFYACKQTRDLQDANVPEDSIDIRSEIKNWRKAESEADQLVFVKIDTPIHKLVNSKYDDHMYSTSNPYFDELRYYYLSDLAFERYIYKKILRPKVFYKGDSRKWINTLMLLPKKDCYCGDGYHRLNQIPGIIRDTSSTLESINYLTEVEDVLEEKCATTLNQLQTEVEWRKKIYDALILQLEAFENSKLEFIDEYYEDIYEIMHKLPDSLTSRFAYDHLMENDTMPEYLLDLIDDRYKNWSSNYSYENYSGPRIIYSEDEARAMILRAETIQAQEECDWCAYLIRRLSTRFNE